MFKKYLVSTIRNLKRQKVSSFLNIISLAVGLTAFILIALYIQFELSYEKYHENSERIIRVVREDRAFTPAALATELKNKFPEIDAVARITQQKNVLLTIENKNFLEDKIFWASPETFQIFTIPLDQGDLKKILIDPFSIVISKKKSKEYFGSSDPVGKIIKFDNQTNFVVTGVFKDMPENSHIIMDMMVPYKTYFLLTGNDINSWQSNFSYTYCLLQNGIDSDILEKKISPLLEVPLFKKFGVKEPYPRMYFFQPISEIHLYSHMMQEISVNNDINNIYLFSTIAFLILIIASFNYMNLATARSIQRSKEVGLRKAVGANRIQLILQFLSESLLMTLLATFLAVQCISIILPEFNNLVDRQLSFNLFTQPSLFIGLLIIVIIVGLSAGSYPAMRLSGFKPVFVLSGRNKGNSKDLSLRNILILIQFSITIALIICTLTIKDQMDFVNTQEMGYSKEQIIILNVHNSEVLNNRQVIKDELIAYSGVVSVSTSAQLPNNIYTFTSRDWTGTNPDEPVPIFYNTADYDFTDLFDIHILEGRGFSRDYPADQNGVFLVNEAAVRKAGWKFVLGRQLKHWSGEKGEIIGVMKDFYHQSLHRPIDPLYIYLAPENFAYMAIKINPGHIPETIEYIENVIKTYAPSTPFQYSFFDDIFEKTYRAEQRMASIFSSFSFLAIVIACLGLYGLSAFITEQRTKEIGVRKVLGASISNIILLLSKEFTVWIIIANMIAWPLAWIYINSWLDNFVFRIDIGLWVFLFAGGIALFIALLTVGSQAIKVATTNPIKALRYE